MARRQLPGQRDARLQVGLEPRAEAEPEVHGVEHRQPQAGQERPVQRPAGAQALLVDQHVGRVAHRVAAVVAADEDVGEALDVGQTELGVEAHVDIRALVLALEHGQAQAAVGDSAAVLERAIAEPAVDVARQPFGRRAHGAPGGLQRLGRGHRRDNGQGGHLGKSRLHRIQGSSGRGRGGQALGERGQRRAAQRRAQQSDGPTCAPRFDQILLPTCWPRHAASVSLGHPDGARSAPRTRLRKGRVCRAAQRHSTRTMVQ